MTVTIRRSLILVVCLLVAMAGVVVAQRANAAASTPVVYVATGENFPDALGAASAAAVQAGPVLLVQRDSIPEVTKAELTRLAPDKIVVAGGLAVVSAAVFNQLKAYAPSVVRAWGANRYSTAVEVSKSAFPATTGGGNTAALEARIAQLEALLAGVTRNGDTLLFTGMNLQVVNGLGQTDSKNTLGNLIIGHNTFSSGTPFRGGSHYLVIGDEHQYRSWGGIVAGYANTASGEWASVTGGVDNTASGAKSSVSGGSRNVASEDHSSVSGGVLNIASGPYSSVSGGSGNTASSSQSSISGGDSNTASFPWSSVSGGQSNTAGAYWASILGGDTRGVSGGHGTYPFCGC